MRDLTQQLHRRLHGFVKQDATDLEDPTKQEGGEHTYSVAAIPAAVHAETLSLRAGSWNCVLEWEPRRRRR